MKVTIFVLASVAMVTMSSLLWAHKETEIDLSEVPAVVKASAAKARPGVIFTEAEKIDNAGTTSYELEGTFGDEEIEFLIREDGTLIEIEVEDD